MKRERRHVDRKFKRMAMNLCLAGRTVKEVARELGLRNLVCKWKREFYKYDSGSFSGHGNSNMIKEQKEEACFRFFTMKKAVHSTRL